jgi:hypothetical protein
MILHYERDKKNNPTGITYCEIDGYQGFSFCHPGNEVILHTCKDEHEIDIHTRITRPDQFSKKIGRSIALGRAEKLKKMIEVDKVPHEDAFNEIYKGFKMKKRINEYMHRNMDRFQEKVDTPQE